MVCKVTHTYTRQSPEGGKGEDNKKFKGRSPKKEKEKISGRRGNHSCTAQSNEYQRLVDFLGLNYMR